MEHKFEYDGQSIVYRSGTVRDREARKLVLRKLYTACGGSDNIAELELEAMWDYANFITHTSPFNAAWRREVGDTSEALYEGFTLFYEGDGGAYDIFRGASLNADMPEKKS
jgi:hypothetical protein